MATRLSKAWRALTPENVASLPAHLGVFQLGNDEGKVLFIGCADATTRFGLREVLGQALDQPVAGATRFRTESTMAYHSRVRELLQVHATDFGAPPPTNAKLDTIKLGVVRPG